MCKHISNYIYMCVCVLFSRSKSCILMELIRGSEEKIRFSLAWWVSEVFRKCSLPMEYILFLHMFTNNGSFSRKQCLQFYKILCFEQHYMEWNGMFWFESHIWYENVSNTFLKAGLQSWKKSPGTWDASVSARMTNTARMPGREIENVGDTFQLSLREYWIAWKVISKDKSKAL